MFDKAEYDRFWAKVDRRGPDECWNWTGAKLKGYGLFHLRGKVWRDCLHSCDNPSCVNPAHLSAGTHQENMADRERKGRGDERHGCAKLTESMVREIRVLYATGAYTMRQLAERFGVIPETIRFVIRRIHWAGVE